jgi:hypothetical protein
VASILTFTSARNAARSIATNAAAIDVRIVDRRNAKLLVNAGERNRNMIKQKHRFLSGLLLVLMALHFTTYAQNAKDNVSSKNQSKNKESARLPFAKRLADGTYTLVLPQRLQEAVAQFLRRNAGLRLANFNDSGGGEELVHYMRSGEMQYPFACWGDLNRDGLLDVALVFVSEKSINTWGWREWWIVAFHGNPTGQFTPVVVTKDSSGCFDGLLYHRRENWVEFFCSGVAAGSFKWGNDRYVVKPMVGD